jgi:hypothetical protein
MVTRSLFLFFFLLSGSVYAIAQTADEVIDKYSAAIGGKGRLDSLKATYMEGVSVMDNGTAINYKIYRVGGKLLRREVGSGAMNTVTIITDKQGWASDRFNPGSYNDLPQGDVKIKQFELECVSPLVDYKIKGHKARLAGTEMLDGSLAYKIELSLSSGQLFTYYIDSKTNFIVREIRTGTGGDNTPVQIDYGGYKKNAAGYVFPLLITGRLGIIEITKVVVNPDLDGKLYKP